MLPLTSILLRQEVWDTRCAAYGLTLSSYWILLNIDLVKCLIQEPVWTKDDSALPHILLILTHEPARLVGAERGDDTLIPICKFNSYIPERVCSRESARVQRDTGDTEQ